MRAIAHFSAILEWLHADTTSVYFEGAYEDEHGQPIQEEYALRLVPGYNKDGKPQNVQYVLSLITSQRVPWHYRPWNGNQSDYDVYLADLNSLRKSGLDLRNTVLIFDRKGCNRATLLELCKFHQLFLGAHPWTDRSREKWEQTWQELHSGERTWADVDDVVRNDQRQPAEARPRYRACEVASEIMDETTGKRYPLRWVFGWNGSKAELEARQRRKGLETGEQALQKVTRLLGKYDYPSRTNILHRLETLLKKAEPKIISLTH